MENKYYDNTPIIEYPLIVAELKQQLKAKDELIEWYERRFAQILDCKYEADKIMCIVEGTLGKSQKEVLSQYKKERDLYAPRKIT